MANLIILLPLLYCFSHLLLHHTVLLNLCRAPQAKQKRKKGADFSAFVEWIQGNSPGKKFVQSKYE